MGAATNRWKMSRVPSKTDGLIGPNAILQLLPILDRLGGSERRKQILARAGIFDVPDGTSMIPETQAARLHRQMRIEEPEMAPVFAREAGTRTADYILQNRIPAPAQWMLKTLPATPAAMLLARAIAKNAWTFVGSGKLTVVNAWAFSIEKNPLVTGETSHVCLCDWHTGVFSRLYQVLVCPSATCHEVRCCAQSTDGSCHFEITRRSSFETQANLS